MQYGFKSHLDEKYTRRKKFVRGTENVCWNKKSIDYYVDFTDILI